MGDILNFVFNSKGGIFIIQVIGLVAVWLAVRQHLRAAREHLPTAPNIMPGLTVKPHWIISTGLRLQTRTMNEKMRLLEFTEPIQSARFIKPVEKIVRPNDLPVIIPCEKSIFRRFRNVLLSVPTSRIVVREFTGKGIIFDEENTDGADIEVEFYKKAFP